MKTLFTRIILALVLAGIAAPTQVKAMKRKRKDASEKQIKTDLVLHLKLNPFLHPDAKERLLTLDAMCKENEIKEIYSDDCICLDILEGKLNTINIKKKTKELLGKMLQPNDQIQQDTIEAYKKIVTTWEKSKEYSTKIPTVAIFESHGTWQDFSVAMEFLNLAKSKKLVKKTIASIEKNEEPQEIVLTHSNAFVFFSELKTRIAVLHGLPASKITFFITCENNCKAYTIGSKYRIELGLPMVQECTNDEIFNIIAHEVVHLAQKHEKELDEDLQKIFKKVSQSSITEEDYEKHKEMIYANLCVVQEKQADTLALTATQNPQAEITLTLKDALTHYPDEKIAKYYNTTNTTAYHFSAHPKNHERICYALQQNEEQNKNL